MKKNISIILAILMLLSVIPLTANAATIVDSGACGDNLIWTLDDNGTLTISGTGDMYDYDYYQDAPWDNDMVKKLVFEEGITSIGSNAFYGYTNTTEDLIIPEGVTKISNEAFYSIKTEKLVLPETLEYIGEYAFSNSCINEIFISENVSEIGEYAFGCIYADTLRVDTNNAFFSSDDQGILYNKDKTVLIQSTINPKYTNYIIPEGVETISFGAFIYNVYAENIKLPESLKVISEMAFAFTASLEEINLPSNLELIEDLAFHSTGITSVVISCSSDVVGLQDSLKYLFFLEEITVLNKNFNCSAVRLGKTIKIKDGMKDEFRNLYMNAIIYSFEYELGLTDRIDYDGATFKEYIENENPYYINLPFVLRCYKGTSAEEYAKKNGMTVEYLCDEHTPETIPAVAATCTATGLTEGSKCSVCNEVLIEQTVIPVTEHNYKQIAESAYCTKNGVAIYMCDCGDSYEESVPATGHIDTNTDGACDICNKATCSHMCHQSGFNGFIWKIVQFFWRLFKMNPICECGAAHY